MKKTILTSLIVISPIILICQQNGNMVLDSTKTYTYNEGDSSWELYSEHDYNYFTDGRLSYVDESSFSHNEYRHSGRTSYSYDLMGSIIERTESIYLPRNDGLQEWYREMNTYDFDGRLVEKNCYNNDPIAGWIYGGSGLESGRKVYQYDSVGNLTKIFWNIIYWPYEGLKDTLYLLFQYDSNGSLIKEISFEKGPAIAKVPRFKEYNYDLNGNILEKIIYWNFGEECCLNNSDWEDWDLNEVEEIERISYSYDENEKMTEEYHRDRMGYGRDSRIILRYDESGNLKQEYFHAMNNYTWESNGWNEYSYDEYGNIVEKIFNSTNPEQKTVFFWSELSTSLNEKVFDLQLIVYPNPVNNLLTIETEYPGHYSINITSLNGQLIHSEDMEGTTHQLNISSLQKGVYFITIRSKDFVTSRKIIRL